MKAKPADLQSDLNLRPADYKSAALPTELRQQTSYESYYTHFVFPCQALFYSISALPAGPRYVLITFIDYNREGPFCL